MKERQVLREAIKHAEINLFSRTRSYKSKTSIRWQKQTALVRQKESIFISLGINSRHLSYSIYFIGDNRYPTFRFTES